jgi:hypothetical protein
MASVSIVVYIVIKYILELDESTRNGVRYAKINANPRSTRERNTREIAMARPVLRRRAIVVMDSERNTPSQLADPRRCRPESIVR